MPSGENRNDPDSQVRDAVSGEVVGRYGGGTIFDQVWASADQLLVSQQLDDGNDQLVLVESDGSLQTVVEQQPGTPLDPSPFRLMG